jgi:MFS family permease
VASFGLRLTLAATLVALGLAAGLLGLAPGSLPAVAASAVLFGSGTMFMSALLSVWSSDVFRERPSTGFSAALLLFGIGSVAGPAVAGAAAERYGLGGFSSSRACSRCRRPSSGPHRRAPREFWSGAGRTSGAWAGLKPAPTGGCGSTIRSHEA